MMRGVDTDTSTPHEASKSHSFFGLLRRATTRGTANSVFDAEHNYGMDTDKLQVVTAFADQGPSMKRFRPASMGRAHPYVHRTSHVTVTVSER